MKIFFRVDGNEKVGLGHLIRSASLAIYLVKNYNIDIIFLSYLDQACKNYLKKNNLQFIELDTEKQQIDQVIDLISTHHPSLLFLDTPAYYSPDEVKNLKAFCKVVIYHILSPGISFADLFILPSIHHDVHAIREQYFSDQKEKFLAGSEYIILNPRVKQVKDRVELQNNLVITTGGSDPKGILITLLKWLNQIEPDHTIIGLYGNSFFHKEELMKLKPKLKPNIQVQPFSEEILAQSRITICTFGVTTYELLYLEKPVISIGHSLKNAEGSAFLAKNHGAIIDLGLFDDLEKMDFLKTVTTLIESPQKQLALKTKAGNLIQGDGEKNIANLMIKTIQND